MKIAFLSMDPKGAPVRGAGYVAASIPSEHEVLFYCLMNPATDTQYKELPEILVKENDFYILDFEGEPESTIRDRKVKQPPLKDVAGLFRSFHYAIYATIFNNLELYKHNQNELFEAGEILYQYIKGVFLGAYIVKIQNANINIGYHQERIFLLKYAMLEKAVYELGYELNSRPRWAVIPLKGISNIINH